MAGQGFDVSFQRELANQSWSLYGIGMLMIFIRTIARWRRVRSFSHFAVDDWMMLTVVPLLYTGLILSLNLIAQGGGSNLFPPEQFPTFTQKEIDDRIKGSKTVIVSEQCMLNVIWVLKANMLFMFARMTSGTTHIRRIQCVAFYVAIGWIAVQIAFFTACKPFRGYWGMPPPSPQCTTFEHFAIVQASFNLSSDALIIAIPVPMVRSLSLPTKQKIGLCLLFSMGTFVIIAAILTKTYNLSDVYDTAYMFWYTREASVAVYVANLPSIWPLLRENIRFLREHTNPYITGQSHLPQYGYRSRHNNLPKHQCSYVRTTAGNIESKKMELKDSYNRSEARSIHSSPWLNSGDLGVVFGNRSLDNNQRVIKELGRCKGMSLMEVQVDTRVEIQRNSWDGVRMKGLETTTQIEGGRKE